MRCPSAWREALTTPKEISESGSLNELGRALLLQGGRFLQRVVARISKAAVCSFLPHLQTVSPRPWTECLSASLAPSGQVAQVRTAAPLLLPHCRCACQGSWCSCTLQQLASAVDCNICGTGFDLSRSWAGWTGPRLEDDVDKPKLLVWHFVPDAESGRKGTLCSTLLAQVSQV